MSNEHYDAIVIGSGISGMTAAVFLAEAGKRVLIVEQHSTPGGFTHTFKRGKYEWDIGVHYIGQMGSDRSLNRKVMDFLSANQLKWSEMDHVYDRMVFPDQTYDFVSGKDELIAELEKHFPENSDEIKNFFTEIKATTRSGLAFFAEKALPKTLSALIGHFLKKNFLKYSDQTTAEVLEKFISNQKLRSVLAGQYGNYGLPPTESSFAIAAMILSHYFHGGFYPIGGSKAIGDTILEHFRFLGGEIMLHSPVKELIIHKNKAHGILLDNDRTFFADTIISTIGVFNTYSHLLSESGLNSPKLPSGLSKVQPSSSHLCLYLGVNGSAEALELPATNYWIYPDYDFEKSHQNYLKNPNAPFPLVFISFPSAKDPHWQAEKPGLSTIEAVTVAPYEWFRKWEDRSAQKRDEDYQTSKENFTRRLETIVTEHFPKIAGKIEHRELSTPLTTRHYMKYSQGEIYGIDHTPQRFRQAWLRPTTAIKGFYLSGQDIVTDGITGAMISGLLTASVILRKNLFKRFS